MFEYILKNMHVHKFNKACLFSAQVMITSFTASVAYIVACSLLVERTKDEYDSFANDISDDLKLRTNLRITALVNMTIAIVMVLIMMIILMMMMVMMIMMVMVTVLMMMMVANLSFVYIISGCRFFWRYPILGRWAYSLQRTTLGVTKQLKYNFLSVYSWQTNVQLLTSN